MTNEKGHPFGVATTQNGEIDMLFCIRVDGSIEKGRNFTTNDEASLQFWEAVEKFRPTLAIQEIQETLQAMSDEIKSLREKVGKLEKQRWERVGE